MSFIIGLLIGLVIGALIGVMTMALVVASDDKEKGVIVPPCKVGDSIFRVGNGEMWEWLIEHIEIYEDEIGFVDDGENYFTPDKIGKTVFLTKEEAEQSLAERKK